ncbi:uncharacterized protein A4U43_C01F31610 [Asparagus officinalis]|uniref:Uncharacterized protein n=1 Tax=Asparagus officinalis TaxID=4686 RepID=A0A5P1FVC4_ASPOF|nr:uncharacterized protein A4U43_C01F31610 [Asparagus officinalis]
MGNYIGNAFSAVAKEANIKELKAASLSQVATMVANTIESMANEDHFLDLVNWVEGQVREKYKSGALQLDPVCGLKPIIIYIGRSGADEVIYEEIVVGKIIERANVKLAL